MLNTMAEKKNNTLPFLPESWKWKTTPNEKKLLLERPIFHFHDYGRKGISLENGLTYPTPTFSKQHLPSYVPNNRWLCQGGMSNTWAAPPQAEPNMIVGTGDHLVVFPLIGSNRTIPICSATGCSTRDKKYLKGKF